MFNEPMLVETVRPNGAGVWVAGLVGRQSERFRRVTLTEDDIAGLTIADSALSWDETHKSQRYRLGELLRDNADHVLLLTATPHKGAPQNFTLFLQLLDRDAYADVKSIREAMDRRRAPFYLRRTKEAMVYFPERQENGSWAAQPVFTKRIPHTADFALDGPELDLYQTITRFVKRQSVRAAAQGDEPRARAVGFLMALYQRRLASSTYAMRRSLENRARRLAEGLKSAHDLLRTAPPDLPEQEEMDELEDAERERVERILEAITLAGNIERRARAQERRVVPETIARFIAECAKDAALDLKPVRGLAHAFDPARTPSGLKRYEREPGWQHPELAVRYARLSTDRDTAEKQNLEWVTPGHPLFEALRRHSLDCATDELRLIEVKGLAGPTGSILLTPNERRVAEDRRDCYWLYVVTDCASGQDLQQPIPDTARYPWHEVTKVAHYYLSVNALKQPMEIRETERGYQAEATP